MRAEPKVSSVDTPRSVREPQTTERPVADDVDHAPLPGHESGRTDTLDDGDSTERAIGRVALTPLRWAVELGLWPVHGAITIWSRHRMSHRIGGLGDPEGLSFDVAPLFLVESGHGINGFTGGARVGINNVLGEREQVAVTAAAGAGGYVRQHYAASLRSGRRLGDR